MVRISNENLAVNTDGQHILHFDSGKAITIPDRILQICLIGELIVVRTQDPDFRNGANQAPIIKDDRSVNNVDAYDAAGNHLWNIGEIVGNIKMQFDGVAHITATKAKERFGAKSKRKQTSLLICYAEGFVFIVDATNKQLIAKIAGKVR